MTVFFFLSGFLIHPDFTNSSQNFYPFQMILKAFLRLSPSYYLALFAHTLLISTVGLGSKIDIAALLNDRYQCYNVVWEHLLYYQNCLYITHNCNFPFWSMAVTFQLYIVGVFIVWLILRSPILGLATGTFLMVYGSALSFKIIRDAQLDYLIGLEKFSMSYSYLDGSLWNTIFFFSDFYTQTTPWLCTVVMGILFAYFLPKIQRASHSKQKKIVKITLVTSLIFYSIFGLVASLKQSHLTYSLLQTFSPVGMGLILSVLIFIFHPQSRFIDYKLSSETCPMLVHFSRLSYPLYLTHWTILVFILNTASITPLPDKFTFLCIFCGCLVLVYIVSIFLYIFIERPTENIRKIVGI
ncbi:uncharacterized protein LOC141857906 [Brevipalpus obovatus]|uniref:uncharacterized protein LOC141857906 n=1 Tax=Brevipalpus obovatus TaxID=246614 RepID=UPI003D9DCD7B